MGHHEQIIRMNSLALHLQITQPDQVRSYPDLPVHLSISQSRKARGFWHPASGSRLTVTAYEVNWQFWKKATARSKPTSPAQGCLEVPTQPSYTQREPDPEQRPQAHSRPRPNTVQATPCSGLHSVMLVRLCLALFLIELADNFQLKDPTEKSCFLSSLKNQKIQATWQQSAGAESEPAPQLGRGPTTPSCFPGAKGDTYAWTAAFQTAE